MRREIIKCYSSMTNASIRFDLSTSKMLKISYGSVKPHRRNMSQNWNTRTTGLTEWVKLQQTFPKSFE